MSQITTLLIYLLGGTALGLLMLSTGVPAAPLVGAIFGAGIIGMSGVIEIAEWPLGTRTLLQIGIGTVIGTGLTKEVVGELQSLWKPAILITITLIFTGLIVGLIASHLFGIDPLITLLGAAPGGISGMSLVGEEFGVGTGVAALHAVRLVTVLFVLPLIIKFIIPFDLSNHS